MTQSIFYVLAITCIGIIPTVLPAKSVSERYFVLMRHLSLSWQIRGRFELKTRYCDFASKTATNTYNTRKNPHIQVICGFFQLARPAGFEPVTLRIGI